VIQHTQKLQFDRERTAALLEVAQTVSDVQNLMKLLPDIIERIAERLPANRILLYLLDIEGIRGFHRVDLLAQLEPGETRIRTGSAARQIRMVQWRGPRLLGRVPSQRPLSSVVR
jgi:hypothetical protein